MLELYYITALYYIPYEEMISDDMIIKHVQETLVKWKISQTTQTECIMDMNGR